MSFVFPGSQTLTSQQIAQEWRNAGAPANIANVFGNQLTTAEGGGRTGVLYNTAYPSLPGYTPVLAGNQPEYSVGIYGENIYGDLGAPPPSQAYAIGQALTKNPQYQTDVAAQMFSQRGFQPWEGDAYVKGAGGPSAALRSLGYSSPPQIKGGTAFTANIPKGSGKIATSSKVTTTGPKRLSTQTQSITQELLTPVTTLASGGSAKGLNWWPLVLVAGALFLIVAGLKKV